MRYQVTTGLIVATIAASTTHCLAQKKKKVTLIAEKPRCVLVELPSETNRISSLTKAGHYGDAEIVKKDAEMERDATIRDFRDHFHFCPVYFYSDSNTQMIRDRNFTGVLTDTLGNVIANPPLNGETKDYLIAYFDLPTNQWRRSVVDSVEELATYGEPYGKALVVCNYKFQQLKYFYRLGSETIKPVMVRKKRPYFFESKKFNIEYYPLAEEFNESVPGVYER